MNMIDKRHEEISQVKMFNLNLWKNKSYYMNFIHKNMSYMYAFITYEKIKKYKVHVVWLVFS